MSGAVIETPIASGEIVLVPAALQDAVDAAAEHAARVQDPQACHSAFTLAFVTALHERGLILVARAGEKTRNSVDADVYSLALSGKYEAEERLGWLAKLVLGAPEIQAMQTPLLEQLGALVLALTGRAPPTNAGRLAQQVLLRLRGAAAILAGARDLTTLPALSPELQQFVSGDET